MFGSQVLEVAIGLTFIYLLLSLICSIITELFARMAGYRSGTLKKALRYQLEGLSKDGVKSTINIDMLFGHTLLRGLCMQGRYDAMRKKEGRPSYIPGNMFVLALFDTVTAAGAKKLKDGEIAALDAAISALTSAPTPDQDSADLIKEIKSNYSAGGLAAINDEQIEALKLGIAAIKDETQKNILTDLKDRLSQPYKLNEDEQKAIDQALTALPTDGSDKLKVYLENLKTQDIESRALQTAAMETFKQLEQGLDGLGNAPLKDSLQSILSNAKIEAQNWDEALAKARTGLETWFDDYMNRVNGWYKRNTQLIILILAFFIALVGNVDTVAIGKALWLDGTLREAVANQATTFVVQPEEEPDADSANQGAAASEETDAAKPADPSVSELQQELRSLGLPIGWYAANDGKDSLLDNLVIELPLSSEATPAEIAAAEKRLEILAEDGRHIGRLANRWPMKIVGLLVTALAISLGAPFWFDLLGKLVNMRSTGKPVEEQKKDPSEVKLSLGQ